MLARKPYPSDLSDAQWELISHLIPPAKPGGRPRGVDMREVINALLYLERSGCQWDMLPHDLPPRSSVFEYFSTWLGRSRRLSKDYERTTSSSEAMIQLSCIHQMLKRLEPKDTESPFQYRLAS